jgi:hypothetical protein
VRPEQSYSEPRWGGFPLFMTDQAAGTVINLILADRMVTVGKKVARLVLHML